MNRSAGILVRLAVACSWLWAAACGSRADDPPALWGDRPVEPLDLRAEVSATEVALLQPLTLRVDLYRGAGVEAEFKPAVPEGFTGTVQAEPPRALSAGTWQRWVLVLQPLRLGQVTIPPFKVESQAGQAASTKEWSIEVKTVLAAHGAELEAPAPPFPPRVVWWPWLLVGAGALALVALAWWWVRRPLKPLQLVEMPLPPHVKALRALVRLRNQKRSTPEQVESFYVEVSQVLRVYLEERFGLHAPERTTEEFLAEVEQGGALAADQRGQVAEFLRQCDLVKFARVMPSEDVHAKTFEIAERLVEATRADRTQEGAA